MSDPKRPDTMTTHAGRPVESNDRSMTAGPRGPVLMQDVLLVEKMAQFNRERVPERVVHAKGYGAFGSFEVTNDITKYTCADFLSKVGKKTELFARFSTVGGESGSADTARDPRGFAVKFYTEEGNWDMVGNNTPIFFLRDPTKFSDFIRTQKREPGSHLKPHWRRWDYWSMRPEAIHQVMVLYSDRGTPYSARFMNGYASHTMSLYNAEGERFWVKWHFKTDQGILNLQASEADRLAGEDPDYSTRDLYNAIENGEFPTWTVCIQVMTEEQAESYEWHPFDLTKVWPHGDFPLIEVGRMTLNRNPSNYFQDVEQAAFEPGNLVPGVGLSPDRMLLNRALSYPDAHRYRIGTNYMQIPVNQPRGVKHVNTYHRDGHLRLDGNGGHSPDYEPNTFGGPRPDPSLKRPSFPVGGEGDRWDAYDEDFRDWFGQATNLWSKVFDDGARERLVDNIVGSMEGSPERIQKNMMWQFYGVHEDFGNMVAEGLGLDVDPKNLPRPDVEYDGKAREIPSSDAPADAKTIEAKPNPGESVRPEQKKAAK